MVSLKNIIESTFFGFPRFEIDLGNDFCHPTGGGRNPLIFNALHNSKEDKPSYSPVFPCLDSDKASQLVTRNPKSLVGILKHKD